MTFWEKKWEVGKLKFDVATCGKQGFGPNIPMGTLSPERHLQGSQRLTASGCVRGTEGSWGAVALWESWRWQVLIIPFRSIPWSVPTLGWGGPCCEWPVNSYGRQADVTCATILSWQVGKGDVYIHALIWDWWSPMDGNRGLCGLWYVTQPLWACFPSKRKSTLSSRALWGYVRSYLRKTLCSPHIHHILNKQMPVFTLPYGEYSSPFWGVKTIVKPLIQYAPWVLLLVLFLEKQVKPEATVK